MRQIKLQDITYRGGRLEGRGQEGLNSAKWAPKNYKGQRPLLLENQVRKKQKLTQPAHMQGQGLANTKGPVREGHEPVPRLIGQNDPA